MAAAPSPPLLRPQREPHRGRHPEEPMPTATVALSDEEEYNWDVAGYLLIPSVLTPQQVRDAAARADNGDFDSLVNDESPLLPVLSRLCCSSDSQYDFGGLSIDVPPREMSLSAGVKPSPLEGGTGKVGWVDQARSYFNTGGHRFVHGIRVIWCLGGDFSGYTIVPGSHKSTAETPLEVVTGGADSVLESLGLLQQPPLRPGDVLVVATSALHGLRHPPNGNVPARLVACDYCSNRSRSHEDLTHPTPPAVEEPLWTSALTPVQRVVLGLDPPAVVRSNGEHAWVGALGPTCLSTVNYDEGADPFTDHTSTLSTNPDFPREHLLDFFLWDLCGYLIIRDCMPSGWAERANAGYEWARDNNRLSEGIYTLPSPHGDAFREMIGCPAILQRLDWIMGAGFTQAGMPGVRTLQKGKGRQLIHAGLNESHKEYHYILFNNGRSYAESVNVSIQLSHSCDHGGGLILVPASHKAQYLLPQSIDGTNEAAPYTHTVDSDGRIDAGVGYGRVPQCTVHPRTRPGDVIIFCGFGSAHGVGQWGSEHERRLVIVNFQSRNLRVVRGRESSHLQLKGAAL